MRIQICRSRSYLFSDRLQNIEHNVGYQWAAGPTTFNAGGGVSYSLDAGVGYRF